MVFKEELLYGDRYIRATSRYVTLTIGGFPLKLWDFPEILVLKEELLYGGRYIRATAAM